MFRGAQQITLDSKGRVMVPARVRSALEKYGQPQLVVTIDLAEACLLAYPMSQWESIEAKLLALPNLDAQTRQFQRLLLGHATEIEIDAQGRILLPTILCEYAKLDKDVIILGQGHKFELWDAAHWQKRREAWIRAGVNSNELTEVLKEISL